MIIDFQHHYVPIEVAERQGAHLERNFDLRQAGVVKVTLHERLYNLDEQLKDMDEGGIDVAVLSCLLGWDAPLEDCKLINDKFAEAQGQYPGRFVGLAHIPVLEGEAALKEFERSVRDLGLRGVAITSQVGGLPLDARQLWDFYAKVVELKVPIFVHPAMVPLGYELVRDYDLSRIVGREFDLALAVIRMIAGSVFDAFPNLRIVVAHFGGGVAAIKERLRAKAYRFKTLKRSFDEYFDLLYFDMGGFEGGLNALRCALTGIKAERLVFATDYPQDFTGATTDTGKGVVGIREYIKAIRALDLSESVKAKMLGGTAAELLGLSS